MSEQSAKNVTDVLTPRERECLLLVATNHSLKEVASELRLSPHTVETHLRAARRKLGGLTTRQAARLMRANTTPPKSVSGDPSIAENAAGADQLGAAPETGGGMALSDGSTTRFDLPRDWIPDAELSVGGSKDRERLSVGRLAWIIVRTAVLALVLLILALTAYNTLLSLRRSTPTSIVAR